VEVAEQQHLVKLLPQDLLDLVAQYLQLVVEVAQLVEVVVLQELELGMA
jgi:hypothetical protein